MDFLLEPVTVNLPRLLYWFIFAWAVLHVINIFFRLIIAPPLDWLVKKMIARKAAYLVSKVLGETVEKARQQATGGHFSTKEESVVSEAPEPITPGTGPR